MRIRNTRFRLASCLTVLFLATASFASDGRIEINQASALAGNVTPSDAPGYPVTLDRSGSYVLTGNLHVDSSASAIEIRGEAVQLDLAGFTISGPVSCTVAFDGTRASCTGNGGVGIDATHPEVRAVAIRDGSVRGFSIGLDLQVPGVEQTAFARVRGLTVSESGPTNLLEAVGIRIDAGTIADSRLSTLDGAGIALNEITTPGGELGGIVVDSSLRQLATGVYVNHPGIVYGTSIDLTEKSGISGAGGVFAHNLMRRNGQQLSYGTYGAGVSIGRGLQYAVISDNRIIESGFGVSDSYSPGASTVYRNVIRGSSRHGLALDAESNFIWNHLLNNNGGSSNQQVSGGVPQPGGNWCGDNEPSGGGCYNND